jgi:hypothetical protein
MEQRSEIFKQKLTTLVSEKLSELITELKDWVIWVHQSLLPTSRVDFDCFFIVFINLFIIFDLLQSGSDSTPNHLPLIWSFWIRISINDDVIIKHPNVSLLSIKACFESITLCKSDAFS